jgi:hypothetical protein
MPPNWASAPQNQPRANVAVSIFDDAGAKPLKWSISSLALLSNGLFITSLSFIVCGWSPADGLNGQKALPRKNAATASQMSLALGAMTSPVNLFGREVIL